MHAGDGNVHTNIPVNSDDYAMLQQANAAVARIMALARSLGGVISGEHGIGITKLEYLTADELAPFAALQAARSTRDGRFNRGKLLRAAPTSPDAYTPSFSLIGAREPDPRAVATSARSPTRSRTACAAASASPSARRTCRAPICSTRPRNKILATSLLIEAFLYEEQTRRGVSPAPFRRVRRRRRPLHGLPQVRDAVPGRHRLRRRVDRDAQPAAPAAASANSIRAPRRRCSS